MIFFFLQFFRCFAFVIFFFLFILVLVGFLFDFNWWWYYFFDDGLLLLWVLFILFFIKGFRICLFGFRDIIKLLFLPRRRLWFHFCFNLLHFGCLFLRKWFFHLLLFLGFDLDWNAFLHLLWLYVLLVYLDLLLYLCSLLYLFLFLQRLFLRFVLMFWLYFLSCFYVQRLEFFVYFGA